MVARMFVRFVNTLIKKFSDEKFKEKAKNLQDIISESIKPIMDAVKDFSEALKPFLNIKKQTTDAKGKKSEELVCFQEGMIV
jgi:gas vesicle protein